MCNVPYHRLSQRQIAFLGPLEWTNLFGQKSKVVSFQKLKERSDVCFLIFVCFNGYYILKLRYLRRDSMESQNFLFSVLSLTYIFIIYHALLCSNSQGYDHISGHLCTFIRIQLESYFGSSTILPIISMGSL